ncbi:MAG: dihydrodipicolinate reductase [Rariglobus sp.]|nr:dihydrodipicolinate reductase [Rariglobus sp.]
MSLRIAIVGARGRMGQANIAAAKDAGATVIATLDQGDDLAAGIAQADAVIDFSFHSATAEVIRLCAQHKKALVIGTTGHAAEEKKHLLAEAATIPCVWSGNYSVGVNLLFALTRRASAVLGSDYDAEVVEMHHRFKKDAPSGTAARLLEIILEERKLTAGALRHGREGITIAASLHAARSAPPNGSSIAPPASTTCRTCSACAEAQSEMTNDQ